MTRKSSSRTTLFDVANLAGVGSATVDRVINERGNVSEDIRKRVLDAARTVDVVGWADRGVLKTALGTVLANEEVIDGKSEVGGFPVVRLPLKQWMLRITAFAERCRAENIPISAIHSGSGYTTKADGRRYVFTRGALTSTLMELMLTTWPLRFLVMPGSRPIVMRSAPK